MTWSSSSRTRKKSELLYTLADQRLGRDSTILTSNRPPQDLDAIFLGHSIGNTILDPSVSSALKLIVTEGRPHNSESGAWFPHRTATLCSTEHIREEVGNIIYPGMGNRIANDTEQAMNQVALTLIRKRSCSSLSLRADSL